MRTFLNKHLFSKAAYRRVRTLLQGIYVRNPKTNLFVILRLVVRKLRRDDIDQRASAVTYSLTLSVFPAIIFLFTLIPYIPVPHLDRLIMDFLRDLLPRGIYGEAASTIQDIISKPRGNLLSLGFVLALYSATNGMLAFMTAFNRTYQTIEDRSWLRKRLIATGLTVALAFVLFADLVLLIVGQFVLDWLLEKNLLDASFSYYLIASLRYFIVFFLFFTIISLIYYFAPAIKNRWGFFSFGSVTAATLGILITQLFSYYLSNFASYNKLYGSIGTVIAFMFWLYLIAIVILLGFEINASVDEAKYAGVEEIPEPPPHLPRKRA